MPEYNAMDYATTTCQAIKGALEAVDLVPSNAPAAPYGAALAIERSASPFEPGNAVLVFVSADGSVPSTATMAVGVMHSIDGDPTAILSMCNRQNQRTPVTCVAFSGGTGYEVILKLSLVPQILVQVPHFLKATLTDLAQWVPNARELMGERNLVGIPHTYCDADVNRILAQLHT
jgi:hypothetical protein